MKSIYRKFLECKIDLTSLGIERREEDVTYFCTPKGASIIGWAGVDGIHYCFIRGFGEMVFVISPMNAAPDYVRPLAKSFTDFLRLLLAAGDAGALEQAWQWDAATWERFCEENPPTVEQKKIMDTIAAQMHIRAMTDPWTYIHELQANFDYNQIPYTEDFYDTDLNPEARPQMPEWKVYFDGNFWGHHGRDHAGKEICIEKEFQWAGRQWWIPAVYSCGKGLVVDFCMRVEAQAIRDFIERWNLSVGRDSYEKFTKDQQMEIEREHPMLLDFRPQLMLNGQSIALSHGCSVSYNPCLPKGIVDEWEAQWAVNHYGLDTSQGWVIYRYAFPWYGKRRVEIKSLSLTMEPELVSIPGPHFMVKGPGEQIWFTHPGNGQEYSLTVEEIEKQTLSRNAFGSDAWEFPTQYYQMCYRIHPDLEDSALSVVDNVDSDPPKQRPMEEAQPEMTPGIAAVGIIGGADGPTSILLDTKNQGELRIACSALHFTPVDSVEWRIIFHEKQFEEKSVKLI